MLLGSMENNIISLEERVNVLEHNQKVKVKEVKHEEAAQSEVDKILHSGQRANPGDMWRNL